MTSTFRDMHAERDWLREHVLPQLEERLRRRYRHLEFVDLRWGVETTSEADESARELLVLKVCLDEIERCRPFLVALLGDRYGWVPPEGRMRRAVEEAGFQTDIRGKSITALEIEFGVLDDPEQRARSHFYFRRPLPYDRMPPALAAQYSDAHSPDPQVRERAARLEGLKERIEGRMPGRVHPYSAAWDPDEQEVSGLDEFGRMVLEHLWADLEAEVPPPEQQEELTWRDEERETLEEFVELSSRDFVGRREITAALLDFACSPSQAEAPWAVCATGPAGSGKSALLAHVYRELRAGTGAAGLVLAHFAGVTPRSASVDGFLFRWIEELAGFLGEQPPVEEGAAAEELEDAFASLLGRAAQRTRIVVMLDALNQLEPTARGRHLTWLPTLWPPNARLLASAIPCSASQALLARPGAVRDRDLMLSSGSCSIEGSSDVARAMGSALNRRLG